MLPFDTNSFLSAQITECNARPDRGVGVVGSTLMRVIVFSVQRGGTHEKLTHTKKKSYLATHCLASPLKTDEFSNLLDIPTFVLLLEASFFFFSIS